MQPSYKPTNYSSLSPYLIVDNAHQLIEQLQAIFGAKELRRYVRPDGSIGHTELMLDDTVLMLSSSTEQYPAHKTMLHLYVPNVYETFAKAIATGCRVIDEPGSHEGDPDIRGSFYDCADNYWTVSTQSAT